MTRAVDLLKNKFGVSQLYKHDIKQDDEIILTVYWNPLTIAERESIQKKTNSDDANDFALQLMIEKAKDENGTKLFQDGDRASLRREVEASVLQEIQLAMINAGADKEVKEAKADLKS
nr:putative phage tail assembly chaperone [uncultured Mediterranean phage uvMED]BAR21870.1 putative phage tail assembly chaperone [uncultured Mediterranean phage uvMED]BAR21882.1 putative phage tail assembly chaperone [uncultured Mediterranean phage uvMED]